jgi:glycine/D-amino acid oxidase-like deaminating enzyme
MQKVTIIGCGVVGAAIAYELSRQPDLQITVIDRNMPAQESTGAALGVLIGVGSQRGWQLRQISMQRYETLVPELEAITGLNIPYNRQGVVLLATLAVEMEKWAVLAELRKSQGWELQMWQPETLGQKCPQINLDRTKNVFSLPLGEALEARDSHIWGAMYSPCDRQIDPVALTNALVAAAQKNGVKFHFGVHIANLNNLEISPRLQQLSPEQGDTDWLILATGLGTTELTKTIGMPVDIRPVLGQAIQLAMPHALGDPTFQPVISGHDIHIVPLAHHHYWIGATLEFANEQGEVSAQKELLETLRKRAINFCPALAEGEIIKTWSGLRPRPEAQVAPIIKKLPNHDRIILATGHYRNGVLLAPATAIAVREILQT